MRVRTLLFLLVVGLAYAVVGVAAELQGVMQPASQAASAQKAAADSAEWVATSAAAAEASIGGGKFDQLADAALATMRREAETRKVAGVGLVAYFDGEKIEAWTSKMLVVGRMKVEPNDAGKGSNLLAIAYAKASEMADTLRNSGSGVRPPLTGEVGWEGGVIVRVKTGYLIAAFSGGQSSEDVAISKTGVTRIVEASKANH